MLNLVDDIFIVLRTFITKKDRAVGVIPIYKDSKKLKILLVESIKGNWSFPKGHSRFRENDLNTALRELKEETGIEKIRLYKDYSLEENYNTYQKKLLFKTHFKKSVKYFIGFTNNKRYRIPNHEIKDIGWFTFEQAQIQATFPNTKKLLKEVKIFLNSHQSIS